MKLHIPDMSCGHCVATIDKAVKATDPSAIVRPDLAPVCEAKSGRTIAEGSVAFTALSMVATQCPQLILGICNFIRVSSYT